MTKIIRLNLHDIPKTILSLGHQEENDHTIIHFTAPEFADFFPSLKVTNPNGETYSVVLDRDGSDAVWTVTDADLVYSGRGEYQLTFVDGDHRAKTYVGKTKIDRSLTVTGDAPDPVQDWIDRADEKLADVDSVIRMDAEATTLEPGQPATAEMTEADGHKRLLIGVPEGPKGDKGDTYELTQEDKVEIAGIAGDAISGEVKKNRDDAVQAAQDAQTAKDASQRILGQVTTEGAAQVQAVQTAGDGAVQAVQTAGGAAVQAVQTAGASAVQAVETAGSTQVGAVNAAGTTQTSAVNTAGTTQVEAVNRAGAAQVEAIEEKGAEIIERIPEVEQLQEDVDELNEKVSGIEDAPTEETGNALTLYENGMTAAMDELLGVLAWHHEVALTVVDLFVLPTEETAAEWQAAEFQHTGAIEALIDVLEGVV